MSAALEVKVPFENVNDPTAKLLSWKVPAGSLVQAGAVVAELENSKATFEVTSPVAGVVEYSRVQGEEVPVGETLFCVRSDGLAREPAQAVAAPAAAPEARVARGSGGGADTVFSKRAQELVAELGLDAALFSGLRFVKESDVRQKAAALGTGQRAEASKALRGSEVAVPEDGRTPAGANRSILPADEVETVPLERAKLVENRELAAADRAALKSTIYFLCPAAGMAQACARQSPPIPRLVVALYETVKLLAKFRLLNACCAEDAVLVYRHVHIGFAVDLGRGLKVLVVRNAETLSFTELASKVEELLVKYTTDSLAVADVTGSTFTVTDLGQEGAFAFAPLLNARQAAILGIGAETTSPAGGPAGFMLSCTFDHRLAGGKLVAEFLSELSARLKAHADSLQTATLAGQPLCCSRCLQSVEDLRAIRAFLLPSVEPPGYVCTNCLSGF